jgi:hypothetical protein
MAVYGVVLSRASTVRGKSQANIVVVVVGRIVVTVGRAQVDRLIVPAAAAPVASIHHHHTRT